MLNILLYSFIVAVANRLRGGLSWSNGLLRVGTAVVTSLAGLLIMDWWLSIITGVYFAGFMTVGHGAWFDIGTKEPEPERGSWPLKQTYNFLMKHMSDAWADFWTMVVKGLFLAPLIIGLCVLTGNYLYLLTIPVVGLLWGSIHALNFRVVNPNWAVHEWAGGLLFGLTVGLIVT